MPTVITYICPVCQKDVEATYYTFGEEYPDSGRLPVNEGALCDFADPDGCFKIYHEECIGKHECPATKKRVS